MPLNIEIEVRDCEILTLEIADGFGVVPISSEPDNRVEMKPDGLYVRDRLDPDPVAYYLLSRG